MLAPYIEHFVQWFSEQMPHGWYLSYPFIVRSALAILLVSLVCGAVGSLVVGNRMSFFSDALAHCAFAGVAIGFLLALAAGYTFQELRESRYFLTAVMIIFGVSVGLLIVLVREKTGLANDTVIGVFFAGSMGLGAMLLKPVSSRGYINLENILFGAPDTVVAVDIEWLLWLTLVTGAVLAWLYNELVFASFSTSLARSRRVRVRLCMYVFIALLAVIVNVCIQIVGALLINGLLIVPAATAANISKNMRQFFHFSILITLAAGLIGYAMSLTIKIPDPPYDPLQFGIAGTIVVVSVVLFALSVVLGPVLRRSRTS